MTLTRTAGFSGEVALSLAGLPANVTAGPKPIQAKMTEAKVVLTVPGNAKAGAYSITVTGKAKHNGRDYAISAPVATLTIQK